MKAPKLDPEVIHLHNDTSQTRYKAGAAALVWKRTTDLLNHALS
jgi:hypothetical protein